MGRRISEHRRDNITEARKTDPDNPGPVLGELVVDGNIPIAPIAEMLEVSEPTVYRWMYGESYPREVYHPNLKKLITILRKAKRAKELPLRGPIRLRIDNTIALVRQYRPVVVRPH